MLPVEGRGRRAWVLSLAAVFLLSSFTGCTTLRRKFVRKKKTGDVKESVMPVLQPEEYAPRVYTPIERYREHFSVLRGYFSDLWATLGRDESGKREQFLLSQVKVKIDAMADLLKGEKGSGLRKLSDKVQAEARQLEKAHAMRRYDIVSSDLRVVEREVRRYFKPELIEKDLK